MYKYCRYLMALKDLGEKGIVDPYPPLVDIKGISHFLALHIAPFIDKFISPHFSLSLCVSLSLFL